jgi:hypothetical protein
MGGDGLLRGGVGPKSGGGRIRLFQVCWPGINLGPGRLVESTFRQPLPL